MLTVLDHPLIIHKLTKLRSRETGTKEFRESLNEIAALMAYEITRNLPLRETKINTPLAPMITGELARDVVLIPILRAGLGMVEGISGLIPTAKVGHLGLYRDHETLEPRTYYTKLPPNLKNAIVMVLDPMLATGGSACEAVTLLKKNGAANIRLISVVGTPEGVRRMENNHPDVDIYLAALDNGLNEQGYIVPGLGDAGDRLFGTK
ncbi:MAG: uracil phosphoribosyltransferase [Bacteroidales bacterium]|jgi:uracil phosphoribosyltransferase|nr:uracil phosphoribosyltransferase [Bacteroidales bacterium]